MPEPTTKRERLTIFFDRLATLPAVPSAQEAIDQIADALNAVEDEFSGIPFAPETRGADGRMYPVQADNIHRVDELKALRLRSRGQNTFVGDNGAIEIREAAGAKRVLFAKPGADGRSIREQ